MRRRLAALPPYQGGKRRLLGQIFKHLPRPAEAPVFVDAFLGGGSVSLFAKARGYRVITNDIALRSQIVGEALIANDRVTLMRAYVRGELRVTALGRGIRSPKRFRPEWVDAWLESLAKGGTEQAS